MLVQLLGLSHIPHATILMNLTKMLQEKKPL